MLVVTGIDMRLSIPTGRYISISAESITKKIRLVNLLPWQKITSLTNKCKKLFLSNLLLQDAIAIDTTSSNGLFLCK